MDTVPDKQFPAEGKVYEEAPKPLPGLAGESRSADANGSWFRVLAAGGKNLVTFKPGVFGTTPEPLLGANPPKPQKRPPLNGRRRRARRSSRRTCARTRPRRRRSSTVNTNSPAFQARYALARGEGDQVADASSSRPRASQDVLKVAGEDATPQLIDKIAKGAT